MRPELEEATEGGRGLEEEGEAREDGLQPEFI